MSLTFMLAKFQSNRNTSYTLKISIPFCMYVCTPPPCPALIPKPLPGQNPFNFNPNLLTVIMENQRIKKKSSNSISALFQELA